MSAEYGKNNNDGGHLVELLLWGFVLFCFCYGEMEGWSIMYAALDCAK